MVMVLGSAGDRDRAHRPVGGLGAAFTGAVAAVMMTSLGLDPVSRSSSPGPRRPHRCLAGVLDRLSRVPSFIVTLAGMLLFRGLTLWMRGGQPIGRSTRAPCDRVRLLPGVHRHVPDRSGPPRSCSARSRCHRWRAIHLSTLLMGALLSVAVAVIGLRSRREQLRYGFTVSPTSLFVLRNVLITVGVMFLAYRIAGYNGLPMVALIAFILVAVYMFLTLRTVIGRRIYAGWQRQGAMLSASTAG